MKHFNTIEERRKFIKSIGIGALGLGIASSCTTGDQSPKNGEKPKIQGFNETGKETINEEKWKPISDRKVRVGIVGYGLCKFGALFGFQNHPNVEVVAVSDLFPDRCAELAKACNCSTTYPSLEELVKDDSVEAVFIATDPPNHAKHAIEAMNHGKHVATAVPAVYGSIEDAHKLLETVKRTGLNYMMFETSCFREDLYAMHQLYDNDLLGKLVYSEGEYFHYGEKPYDSFKGWRVGIPPQWYPTHSNAYHLGVSGESYVEVSCVGIPSLIEHLKAENNSYKNPFGTEIALFKASQGGASRMGVSWDTPGDSGERGRVRGQKGSYYGKYEGLSELNINIGRPALPPGVEGGGHGGSHGRLTDEFISSILEDRKPWIDVALALNMTVSGIVAHESAMKDGELLKIPQFNL